MTKKQRKNLYFRIASEFHVAAPKWGSYLSMPKNLMKTAVHIAWEEAIGVINLNSDWEYLCCQIALEKAGI